MNSGNPGKVVYQNKLSTQKKKINWFCNRALSPAQNIDEERKIQTLQDISVQDKNMPSWTSVNKIEDVNSYINVQAPLPETDISSCNSNERICEVPHENKLSTQKKRNNWFCNRALSPIHSPLPEPVISHCDFNETEFEISSYSSDPFADSGDSSYEPSDIEVSSSAPEISPPDFDIYTPLSNHDNHSDGDTSLEIHSNQIYSSTTASRGTPSNDSENGTEATTIYKINEMPITCGDAPNNGVEDGIELSEISKIDRNKVSSFDRKSKGKVSKQKNFCYYCESHVLNFARHIINNHSTELDVIKLSSMPTKSLQRRRLLSQLRNKGNFLETANNCPRRVRRSQLPNTSVLPCDNCLGFFSSKLLYRHRKKCGGKRSGRAQSEGQTILKSNIRVDERLKREVFPRMRADKISLEAKGDNLICSFGARYLRSHREKHFAVVTSRKMRELSKILIEIKKIEPSIKSFFQALKPKYFDYFVQATQTVANYNTQTEVFEAPTFAINIVNSFKQCCDIAINFVLKGNQQYESVPAAEAESQLRTMIHLFTANWKFEISSQAASNLHLNKWNKVTIVPLASDLKVLRSYLLQSAKNAIERLQINSKDVSAYNILVDTIHCRVILLNRRRPGELQRMLLHTFLNCGNDKAHYEEFDRIVTPSERVLLKKLKRVVIRGKRGRGVPVLFSDDVQDNIEVMLEYRTNFVHKENLFLFAKANSTGEISGYKILAKYARECGAKNPTAITSTRLRKHLATLAQIFNMADNDIEQLATFMGHTSAVHRGSYRLPDDDYQVAKLSKLLLLMEKGGADNWKGKTLEEIDLNMEQNLLEENNETEEMKEIESDTDEEINDMNSKVAAQTTVDKNNFDILNMIPETENKKRKGC